MDAGDFAGRAHSAPAGLSQNRDGDDRRDRHQRCQHAPERQLAPKPAPIDDHIRIKRHRDSPGYKHRG